MPNWCDNRLTVSGPTLEVQRFFYESRCQKGCTKHNNTDTELIQLDHLVPMPQELLLTTSPTPKDQEELQALCKEKYGAPNWYEWKLANWGTKWDLCEVKINNPVIPLHRKKISVSCNFDTAWNPPISAFNTISKMFPRLTFTLNYTKEGCKLCKKIIWLSCKHRSEK